MTCLSGGRQFEFENWPKPERLSRDEVDSVLLFVCEAFGWVKLKRHSLFIPKIYKE
jgi:hypothetical protein